MYEGCCHFLYPHEMVQQMVMKFTCLHVNDSCTRIRVRAGEEIARLVVTRMPKI